MNPSDVVTVRRLRKCYGDRVVVDDLDLQVAAGEIVGLIGANGAGKTTTVECIQGLRRPDRGSISVFGLDPTTQADRLRALIGSQLQDSALPDRLRVGEALDLFGARDGEELLETFGLTARRRCAFASLSGGERQRLFLVLALANRPKLVILDELTQGLDPAARRSVWAAVAQLRTDGTAVLLVTHELDEAEALCDRVVAIRAGRVLDTGSPQELVDRYGRSATIGFSLPSERAAQFTPDTLQRLPGVVQAQVVGCQVTILGDRTAIAHLGAYLVHAGWVPPDLSVHIPTLEEALLDLLDRADRNPDAHPSPDADPSPDAGGTTLDLAGVVR